MKKPLSKKTSPVKWIALAAAGLVLPRDITGTANRYKYHRECNSYWGELFPDSGSMGVAYNQNGIVSYIMDWKAHTFTVSVPTGIHVIG